MRLALIFALIAAPAFARDQPPEPPTYEKPKFEQPKPPEPPKPPKPPKPDNPDEPRVIKSTPKPPPVSCPKVKCVTDENGKRRAMFTGDVQPDMYYLGRNFCASVPKHITEVTACCLEDGGKYKIQYNISVPKKSHWKAKQFCACVLGLD